MPINTISSGEEPEKHVQPSLMGMGKPDRIRCNSCMESFIKGLGLMKQCNEHIKNKDKEKSEKIMQWLIIQRTIKSLLEQNLDVIMRVLKQNIESWLIIQKWFLDNEKEKDMSSEHKDTPSSERKVDLIRIKRFISSYIPEKRDDMRTKGIAVQYTPVQFGAVVIYTDYLGKQKEGDGKKVK